MLSYSFLNNDFFDLIIYQYGYEKCLPGHSFGPALRSHYLLHYVISGKGFYRLQLGNELHDFTLEAGQAFLIVPDKIVYYVADTSDPWEYMWIEVDGLKAREYLGQAGLTRQTPIYHPVSPEAGARMADYLAHIVTNHTMPVPETMGYAYLFFNALIQSSDRRRELPKNSIQVFYIQSAIGFIEQHYMEDITVDDMAAALNLNRSYFSKLFKKMTQKSPQTFLIAYRVNRACELLRSTKMSIGEISSMVGYSNQFHFSRAFKNAMELSPNEWRKRHQAEENGRA